MLSPRQMCLRLKEASKPEANQVLARLQARLMSAGLEGEFQAEVGHSELTNKWVRALVTERIAVLGWVYEASPDGGLLVSFPTCIEEDEEYPLQIEGDIESFRRSLVKASIYSRPAEEQL